MPIIEEERLRGMIQADEYHEIDYGKLGVTRVVIYYSQADTAEQERNRATLVSIAQTVIGKQTEQPDTDLKA